MGEISFKAITRRIGKSIVVTIPKEIENREKLKENDFLEIIEVKKL